METTRLTVAKLGVESTERIRPGIGMGTGRETVVLFKGLCVNGTGSRTRGSPEVGEVGE